MIYVTTSTQPQTIYVPRNGFTVTGSPALSVVSTATLKTVAVPVTNATVEGDFVRLVFTAPAGLKEGEWRYTLTDGSSPTRALASGLIVVRAADADTPTEYNATIEYKEYGE